MCLLAGQTVLSDAEAVFGYMGPRCVRGCVGWCAVGLQMCVCVPVCGALHSCHAWGSTLLAQLPLCALAGEHGCSSGGGDLNEMQPTSAVRWMRLQPGSPPARARELGHKSAFVCQNTVICVELRTPSRLKLRCSLCQVHSISIDCIACARVPFIPRRKSFFFLFFFSSPLSGGTAV